MYFHLIWIKEKDWKQHELDLLLQWDDENLVRGFLSHRWVVIVSLNEFKEKPEDFGAIKMSVLYNNAEIEILMKWEDLSEALYSMIFLGLNPKSANYLNDPVSEDEMNSIIASTNAKILAVNQEIQEKKEMEERMEQKKYEESAISNSLKIINTEIDRIEQVIKAGQWVILWIEMKELEDYLNEMKKIRLWTNFNKMASLVFESHRLVKSAEAEIFKAYDSQKFAIDKNSSVTNVDVINDIFDSKRISEKWALQASSLTPGESVLNMLWPTTVFLKLLKRDIIHTFQNTTADETFGVIMNMVEYFVLTAIIVLSILWLIAPLIWVNNFSLYFLPALWWLALLIYLFNNLKLEWIIRKILWFVILVFIYRRGLVLLLNTFSL